MNNEELKTALFTQKSVRISLLFGGEITNAYVTAIIYRRGKDGKPSLSVEATDKNHSAVYICDPKQITDETNEKR